MKANLSLLLFAVLLSVGLGVLGGQTLKAVFVEKQPVFEDLDDLRKKMSERSPEDRKAGGSVSFRYIVKPHPSDKIIYELRPNLDVKFVGKPLLTNSHGMRGPETTLSKPKDTFRVAVLGDSFPFGWGVEQQESFPHLMEGILQRKLGKNNTRIEVLNFGIPGYSTFQEVAAYIERWKNFDADLVLVFFVSNDFGPPFYIKSLEEGKSIVSSHVINHFRKKGADQTKRKKHDAFLKTINPNHALKRLALFLNEKNIPLYVAINPRKGVKTDERNLGVLRSGWGIKYIPMRKRNLEKIAEKGLTTKELSLPTDPHPSPIRHQLYAEILSEALEKDIAKMLN